MGNRWWSAVAAVLAVMTGAAAQQPQQLTFGVYSFKQPTDVYKEFQPALKQLQLAATTVLGTPLHIELRVFKTYEECLEAFVAGKVDFVRFGPASYVLAKQRNAAIELLAAEQEDGRKVCKGVVVVRKDSDIKTLADLRGRRFAFGDQQSTIGRYLSQAELLRAGIDGKALKDFRYLDRHDLVYAAVQLGDFDAGAVHGGTFERLNQKGQDLRVIHSFDNVGKPWIARAGLERPVLQALREALLQLTDAEALKALQVSGFLPATDKDYQPVRDGMKLSAAFAPPVVPAPAAPPKDR